LKFAFNLRAALTLLVLIATVPAFVIVVQAYLAEQRRSLDRAEASLKAVVDLGVAHQDRLVEGARQILAAIAYSPPVYGDDLLECAGYMTKLQGHYSPEYGSFGMLDDQGRLTCRSTAPAPQVVSRDRRFFRTAVRTGRFSVGDFTISRANGRAVLPFGLPVYSQPGGSLRGVAYLALDVAQADAQLRKLALSPETSLLVADSNAVVVAAAGPSGKVVGASLAEDFLLRAVASGAGGSGRGTGSDGREWLFDVEPVGRPDEDKLFVVGMVSTDDVIAPVTRQLQRQLGALTLVTLFGALAAWIFGDRVVARPVARILQRVDALRREELKLDGLAPAGGLRELRELDRAFHAMARSLAERSVQRDGAMAEMTGQKQLVESVLESMGEGVVVIAEKGRIIHANAAAHRTLPGLADLARQRNASTAAGEEWGLFDLDGRTPMAPRKRIGARTLAGESVDDFRFLVRGRLTGGPEKIIHAHGRPLQSAEGKPQGAVVVFSDVTSAHRAEQAVRESEQRYRALFEANPHPMWVYDVDTLAFLTVNDAAVAHYGYSTDEFLSMTIADIRPAEDMADLVRSVNDGEELHSQVPWRHRLKDGRLIHVEISSHSLSYGGRRARMVLAHDVTERRMAQQALEQMNETLERRVMERTSELALSNRELESFSYSVSHDLRAPLQVIDGFGRALLTEYQDQLQGKGRHYLERIRRNTVQMGKLIDDLLSLARVARTEIRAEALDLAPRAAQVIESLRQRFPERGVSVELDGSIPCVGDSRLLPLALENLVENAWKFTARNADARIRIGSRVDDSGTLVVYVADNGAGFDMAYSDKLFHAFQRLHATAEFEGTGVGLATVHRIVTRHGGRVWAQSAPGQGATFQFTLSAEIS